MKRKTVALILTLSIVLMFSVISIGVLSRSISENKLARRYLESTQAFWAAEAGINDALAALRADYDNPSLAYSVSGYSFNIDPAGSGGVDRIITATAQDNKREIEVYISKDIPANFYDNPIYSSGSVDINGNSYTVTAENGVTTNPAIVYGGGYEVEHPDQITGTIAQTAVTPLPRLNFLELFTESQTQDNVYDVLTNGKLVDPDTQNEKALPSEFWYTRADDSVDNDSDGLIDEEDEWKPNVVYITGDLELKGSIGTVGGFLVVVGDVINDLDETEDATINGNGTIEGAIYTRGEFRINGGGGADLNVNGGIWAGDQVRLNGGVNVGYNAEYMEAIKALVGEGTPQICSWGDKKLPYLLP